jgi:ketosteroid isomerase-like protein
MRFIVPAALAAAALAVPLTGCGGSANASAAQSELKKQADMYEIEQLEATWHKAASTKNVDLAVSLFAPDAYITTGTETVRGLEAIRQNIQSAHAFQPENHWVSDTPAYKIRVTVNGDKGTLYFECHYIDVKTGKVMAVIGPDATVQRIGGKWLITGMQAATPTLEP